VAGLALRRRIRLAFQGRHADDGRSPSGSQGRRQVAQESVFVRRLDVFENVQGVNAIEIAWGDRPGNHVVNEGGQRPARVGALVNVVDKDAIEIDGHDFWDFLLNDSGAEGVGTADLQHALAAGEHLGHEFVARESKYHSPGVAIPGFVYHKTKCRPTVFLFDIVQDRILLFFHRRYFAICHTPVFPLAS